MICDQPDMTALFLGRACAIDENGQSICYCQSVRNNVCAWNTLSGNCHSTAKYSPCEYKM